jgi:hypothetical protein
MKKLLFLLLASTSISLMAMNDAPKPLCDGTRRNQQNDYACCSESLPYAHKDPFYQPDLPLPELNHVAYIPQMIPDEPNAPNIQAFSLEHVPRPPYNPAVGLFLAIRSALSSTVTPVQTPAASANHNE